MEAVPLSESQIQQLIDQGCTSSHWSNVGIAPAADLTRLQWVEFIGSVQIGDTRGSIILDGVEFPCGVYHARLADCTIADHVRIANVGSVLANYDIEENAVVQNVGALVVEGEASFGNGEEVDVWNEGGGRTTVLLSDLTAQTAYLQAARRYDSRLAEHLRTIAKAKAVTVQSRRGRIGKGAQIFLCGIIKNVVIGPFALVRGAQRLENGTILSCAEHPTVIGEGTCAKSFIVAEGARVETGAIVEKSFIGQGVKMGKQFSAENSLFFANCEGFHGEALSVFAGPYTVTHHKSTLLIAALFSFYNAGSGTNQSNHMYKLGPVHQGVFERGCKTGSFSYVMHESHVGAFSVVIGKHYANINTPNLPFSHIYEEGGVSRIVPGMNLFSVGTVRDGEKWPRRDNRKAPVKRDLIVFDVFSPYTVEKMRKGREDLLALHENTPREKSAVIYGGVQINRAFLRKGAKYYGLAISRYLHGKVCEKLEEVMKDARDWEEVRNALQPAGGLKRSNEWTDVAGLLVARERLEELEKRIADGRTSTYDALLTELNGLWEVYRTDEWQYVCDTYESEYSVRPEAMTKEHAGQALTEWHKAASSLHALILEDSKKEFGAFARIGYGIDLPELLAQSDFEAVRGTIDTNSVVQKLQKEGPEMETRVQKFQDLLGAI